jgi:beta-1,4-mannosyltransferase
VVIPHGVYEISTDFEEIEGVPSAGYLCWFGKLRPYKGIVELMEAYDRLVGSRPVLVVAGECSDVRLAAVVDDLANSIDDIIYIDRRLSEGELANLVRNSLGVVLPFKSAGNSGSVMYSLSAGTPVAAPHAGAVEEIAALVGSEWIVPIQTELDAGQLAGVIESFRQTAGRERPNLGWASWDSCADQLDSFLETLEW